MSFILTREQLYELVWSEAMQSLGKKIGMSDVGLPSTVKSRHSPSGTRYWNKVSRQGRFEVTPVASRPATINDVELSGASQRSSASGLPVGPATTVSSKRVKLSDRPVSNAARQGHCRQKSISSSPCNRQTSQQRSGASAEASF